MFNRLRAAVSALLQSLAAAVAPGSSRDLFVFFDGTRQRKLDPLATWHRLWLHPECDLGRDLTTAANPLTAAGTPFYPADEVAAAEKRVLDLIREVFAVKEWTEQQPGLTIGETQQLLERFMEFVAGLKKKRSASRAPLPPSESTEPSESTGTDASVPNLPSDSPSMPSESTEGEPTGLSQQSAEP